MLLVANERAAKLAKSVAKLSGAGFIEAIQRRFPDGEIYIRIETPVEYKEVAVLFSMYPGQNASLTEFFMFTDALNDLGASRITAVIPYLPYARQDKRFQHGEALSIKTLARLFKSVGVSRLVVVDTHFHRIPEDFDFFGIKCANLSAGRLLLEHAKEKLGQRSEVIGPDFGSSELIKYATGKASVMEKVKVCPDCGKEKTECMCGSKEVVYEAREFRTDRDFKGKNVAILDDMIASGTTMINACRKLKSMGAKEVIALATHGLFLNDSLKALNSAADYVAVTDTIETPASHVSVAGLIAGALK